MTDKPAWADFEPNEDDHGDVTEILCPRCSSGQLLYRGEVYDDLEHQGSGYECSECGFTFTEGDLDDW